MGEGTKISWTDNTFNAWIGCEKVSAGCANCYAEAFAKRVGRNVWGKDADREVTKWESKPSRIRSSVGISWFHDGLGGRSSRLV